MGTINITQLNVGWFTAAAWIWRRGDPMDRTTRFPIPAYLIDTDDERILIDTACILAPPRIPPCITTARRQ